MPIGMKHAMRITRLSLLLNIIVPFLPTRIGRLNQVKVPGKAAVNSIPLRPVNRAGNL